MEEERKGGGVGERDTPGGGGAVVRMCVCLCVWEQRCERQGSPAADSLAVPSLPTVRTVSTSREAEPRVRAQAEPGRGGVLGEGRGPGRGGGPRPNLPAALCPQALGIGSLAG